MQTLEEGWKEAVQRGTFSLPYGIDKRASYVDYRDVAEAAAIALTSAKLDYGTFELCAPGMQRMFANYDQYGFPGGNALVRGR